MEHSTTLYFGRHSLTHEPPDTLHFRPLGDVDGALASQVIEQIVEWAQGMPYLVFLMNVDQLSSFSSEGRKIFTSIGHRLPPRIFASFGGSFATKVQLDLMERASWLLGSRNRYITHWPDERSARAWAAEMRQVLSADAHARTKSIS